MAFIEHKLRNSKIMAKAPSISITKRGEIIISKLLHEQTFRHHKYVKLFYDPERKMIGIMPSTRKKDFPIHARASHIICAKSFMNYWKIPHSRTKKYETTVEQGCGMVIFSLV